MDTAVTFVMEVRGAILSTTKYKYLRVKATISNFNFGRKLPDFVVGTAFSRMQYDTINILSG